MDVHLIIRGMGSYSKCPFFHCYEFSFPTISPISHPFLPSVHVRPRNYYKTAHVEHEGKMLGSILVTAKKLIFYITTLITTCFDVYNLTKQMTDLMKVSHMVKKVHYLLTRLNAKFIIQF